MERKTNVVPYQHESICGPFHLTDGKASLGRCSCVSELGRTKKETDLESQGGNVIYDVLEVIEGKVRL